MTTPQSRGTTVGAGIVGSRRGGASSSLLDIRKQESRPGRSGRPGRTPSREQVLQFEATSYHQPSDQLGPEWNFEGMAEDARFAFLATLEIADADKAPTWNAGDEFEAARQAALAQLAH